MARFGTPTVGGTGGSASVQVLGLDELRRDLRAMDKRLGGKEGVTALNHELQMAGNLVANHAKTTTVRMAGMVGTEARRRDYATGQLYGKRRKGYRPGRTQKSIRARVKAGKAIVEARAKSNTGYRFPYPYAYEHGTWKGRGPRDSPKRPFMYPALYAMRDDVAEQLADGIMRVARKYWAHTSGGPSGGMKVG